jgi:hypothetical protein
MFCVLEGDARATPLSIKAERVALKASNNHAPMPIQPRYETWEHDILDYDIEDASRDPYSSPVAVLQVAYSGKRTHGLDTTNLRPAKVQSVPTVRRLLSHGEAAPVQTPIPVTDLPVPLAPAEPPSLPSEVSGLQVGQPYPVEYGPDAPEYVLIAFRAEHFDSIHSKNGMGEPVIDLTQLPDEYMHYNISYHKRMEMVALGLTYRNSGDAITSFNWEKHDAENV